MEPLNFHQQLNNYANAEDIDAFAGIVLGEGDGYRIKDDPNATRVITILEKFLFDNEKNIIRDDLSNLKKVEQLAKTYNIYTSGIVDAEPRSKLINELAKSIVLAEKDPIDAINAEVPESLQDPFSIVIAYHTFPEMMELKKLGMDVSSEMLVEAIENMEAEDVMEFVNWVRKLEHSDSQKFSEMINMFFKHASTDSQEVFFGSIVDSSYFSKIVSLLPKDMTKLNFGTYCLSDGDVYHIVNYFNRLESLEFGDCKYLTNSSVNTIANSPNMQHLEELSFKWAWELNDEAVNTIANSDHLKNLKKLTLTACRGVTNRGITSLASSENMKNLQKLNLSLQSITDIGVRNIVNSPLMSNMRVLCFVDCKSLTNEAAVAIANNVNENLQTNMANLQTLDFSLCKLTDDALNALAGSSHLKQLEKLVIKGCKNLTTAGISVLTRSDLLPNLMEIEIDGPWAFLNLSMDIKETNRLIETMRLRKTTH